MMNSFFILFSLFALTLFDSLETQQVIPEPLVCISENERHLADLINEYRESHGLKQVAISISLTEVAQLHVRDLIEKIPYDENGKCNMHSWSKSKKWIGCCYNSGEDGACMWSKPREMTNYQGDGYEIVMAQFNSQFPDKEVTAEDALNSWKKSPRHNAVLLNKEIWKSTEFKAMGVGIFNGVAAVWFGEEIDNDGKPNVCVK